MRKTFLPNCRLLNYWRDVCVRLGPSVVCFHGKRWKVKFIFAERNWLKCRKKLTSDFRYKVKWWKGKIFTPIEQNTNKKAHVSTYVCVFVANCSIISRHISLHTHLHRNIITYPFYQSTDCSTSLLLQINTRTRVGAHTPKRNQSIVCACYMPFCVLLYICSRLYEKWYRVRRNLRWFVLFLIALECVSNPIQ